MLLVPGDLVAGFLLPSVFGLIPVFFKESLLLVSQEVFAVLGLSKAVPLRALMALSLSLLLSNSMKTWF